jgi:AcrR family transcriptional regulator
LSVDLEKRQLHPDIPQNFNVSKAERRVMTERTERVRAAVLAAVVALLDECGVHGLTVEAVAARSGVAKTTIYRHWPTKADLTLDALGTLHESIPTPNTGDLRKDLRACFVEVTEHELDNQKRRIFGSVLDAAQRDPEYAQLLDTMNAERMGPLRTVLELAQHRGQLRADVDLDEVADLVIGPVLARILVSRRPVDGPFIDLVVDALVDGLAGPR